VRLDRVQMIMTELGHVEDEIFKRRHQNELNFKARDKAKKKQQRVNFELLEKTQFAAQPVGAARAVQNPRQEAADIRLAGMRAVEQVTLLNSIAKNIVSRGFPYYIFQDFFS
jgi:5'-3' exoribonuclease 2